MTDNIALVVLDTLRQDVFNQEFAWLPGLRFTDAISPSHWTAPAHASIFTGMYPTEHGTNADQPMLDPELPTLAEKLAAEGYTCRGFSANGNVGPSTGFDAGFDEYRAKGYHPSGEVLDWVSFTRETTKDGWRRYFHALRECLFGPYDTLPSLRMGLRRKIDHVRHGGPPNLTVERAIEFIENTDFGDREFLFLNLMEAHGSYMPPPEYQSCNHPSVTTIDALAAVLAPDKHSIDETAFRQAYDDSVGYLSEYYQTVFELLIEEFDYVITTADHGEALGERDIYGHIPSLVPQITNVPLVITGGGLSGEESETVSLVDVHRTIADLTGVSTPLRGENLLDIEGRPVITEAHGVADYQIDSLRNRDVSDEAIDPVRSSRRGIAAAGYYGYESIFDGWIDDRGSMADPRDTLEALVADLRTSPARDDRLSENVKRQLADLGYR